MEKFKQRWEITKNWQLIHPILGVLLSFGAGYLVARRILNGISENTEAFDLPIFFAALILGFLFIKISLWCFTKLKNRWIVDARWELIAIFIVFAITGSTAGRLSSPIMTAIGLGYETTAGWLYWPLRILLIFPSYQILLLGVAWVFGQFSFFYTFERKMLSRLGLGFLFPSKS